MSCSPTSLAVVHWFFSSGRVLHLIEGISWLLANITSFALEFFLLANSSSQDGFLSPSISLCIPPSVLMPQSILALSCSTFSLVLVPPGFHLSLHWLLLLEQSSHLAPACLPIAATRRDHPHLHLMSMACSSSWNWSVISMQSSGRLVLLTGCSKACLVVALLC